MPYYKWTGIDIEGNTKKGKLFAVSLRQLEQYLLEEEIALLQGQSTRSLFKDSWNSKCTIDFFKQLGFLLESGVYIIEALATLAQTTHVLEQRNIITYIETRVKAGAPLSTVLHEFPDIFDQLMIITIQCGEETGTLAFSLRLLAQHYDMMHTFYKRLRSAAYMPLITLGFFVAIFCIVVVVVIPKLSTLFVQAHQDLPLLTRIMVSMSNFMTSRKLMVAIALGGVSGMVLYRRLDKKKVKHVFDTYLVSLPLVGTIVRRSAAIYFLQTLRVLLKGGISLGQALPLAAKTIQNSYLRNSIENTYEKVLQGYALSTVLADMPMLFNPEVVALVKVGESSGHLETTLEQAAHSYQDQVYEKLDTMVVLFQPTVLLILGSMIGLLIFAVYMPLFEVSSVVTAF